MQYEKIDHVGVAVHSLDSVKKMYKDVLGLTPVFEEEVPEQKVKVVGFKVGQSNIEYLEPTSPDSPIAKFLEKRGEGMHHLCVGVADIHAVLANMKANGMQLIDEQPKTGAEGKQIAFVHPKSMNGILLELSQEK
ncbi:MAG: methylmalonyl-CoA epimerase [Calditrichia bacterium]|nr:methylmalonyl-CoA epimerase [Calditrichota bacterium]MCB0269750.1 methylmalonyl-CoA epimerase [Calditrichota bacterium]MCB9070657.1 methylmalonyl-CoA epimerase [Calditrichia bacterium]